MRTLTTSGIQISVNSNFRQDLSEITEAQFFFNYKIDIENRNNFDVQLLTREWYIFDSLSESRYVSGAGVIGEQPILKPGEKYTYTSGCDLSSELGFMKGFYTFMNVESENTFQVYVPKFKLEYPGKQN